MTNTPAGWYADPTDSSQTRWWDGTEWTDHRPAPYSAATASAVLKAPEGTQANTAWIWLIVFVPMLPMLGLLLIDWAATIDINDPTGMSTLGMFANPGYLLAVFGGWISYGLCAWFAYLDWRELGRRSVPRPFHFAWVFLSSIVYVIGRSVVARRRTGHGIAPLWVAIASMVLSVGVATYVTVVIMTAVIGQVETMGFS